MKFAQISADHLHDFIIGMTVSAPDELRSDAPPLDLHGRLCAEYEGVPPEQVFNVSCALSARGRYLVIQIIGAHEKLCLCELEVYERGN